MNRIAEPQNERSRKTRSAILDAAWALLEEQGGAAVTMAEVARRAGVSRRALYLHFASRGEVIVELMAHVDEVLDLESSIAPFLEAADAVAMLEAFAAHLARYHPQILAIDRAVEHGRQAGDADLQALWNLGFAAWHGGCLALAERLAAEDVLAAPWSVETAADMLLALMRDEVVSTLRVDREWSEEQHRELLSVLLRRTFLVGGEG